MSKSNGRSIDTDAVHAGEPRLGGAVVMPIFQTANFVYEGETDYHAIRYVRLNNTPNHDALHAKLAALERAESALVTASGMAAISTTLLSVLKTGDHLLVVNCPYGDTRNFVVDELGRFGIDYTFIEADDPADWQAKRRPETRAIYVESITNPLMEVPDLKAAVAFAREHGLVSIVDNTFPSPVNFRPAEHGFDLSLHSCTKYLNGHSDIAAGAVIGRRELIEPIHKLLNHLGGVLDPHACFLLQRGIKTLPLRVRRQNESGLKIAKFMEAHPAVNCVNYPGLESHPQHARAAELFDGFGGMLSFELSGGVEAAELFMSRLTIPIVAVSLGGVESLVIRPAVTAYASVPAPERESLGITDALVRLSVGIEDAEELVADLEAALEPVAAATAR